MLKKIILATYIVVYSIGSNSYDFSRPHDSSSIDSKKNKQNIVSDNNHNIENNNSMMVMNRGVVSGGKNNNQPLQESSLNDNNSVLKQKIPSSNIENSQTVPQKNSGSDSANKKTARNIIDLPKEAQTNVLIDNSPQGPNVSQDKPAVNSPATLQNNNVNQGVSNYSGVQKDNNAK